MLIFFFLGTVPAALVGLGFERLAEALEPTDRVSIAARFQSIAIPIALSFALPILGALYVPGIRLTPVTPPPGSPTIVFSASGLDGNSEIHLMRGDASHIARLTDDPAIDQMPTLSPDGTRVTFVSDRDGNDDIYVLDVQDPSKVRLLARSPAYDLTPSWSPDGSRIAFASNRNGALDIWTMQLSGGQLIDLTAGGGTINFGPEWSPDGTRIAFASNRDGPSRIYVMNANGSHVRDISYGAVNRSTGPYWSPDGSRIAFAGWISGNSDVYVMNADGSDVMRLTSDPSQDEVGGWLDEGHVLLISDRPNMFGYHFAYSLSLSGGEPILFLRA